MTKSSCPAFSGLGRGWRCSCHGDCPLLPKPLAGSLSCHMVETMGTLWGTRPACFLQKPPKSSLPSTCERPTFMFKNSESRPCQRRKRKSKLGHADIFVVPVFFAYFQTSDLNFTGRFFFIHIVLLFGDTQLILFWRFTSQLFQIKDGRHIEIFRNDS